MNQTSAASPDTPTRPESGDATALAAVELAREAISEAADVGEHLGAAEDASAPGLVVHRFACARKGYRGWYWAVTLTRASRQRTATVCEVVLLPGEDALVAPSWVPYRERIQPGDMSPGDLLPVADDDPRLVPVYAFGDDPLDTDAKKQIRQVAGDLGLGRIRTLSPEGRDEAASRWYVSDAGPDSKLAQAANDHCRSCGFMVRLNGPLSTRFGVCANGDANDDGKVVSTEHGCGAHSEVRLARKHAPLPLPEHVHDTLGGDDLERF